MELFKIENFKNIYPDKAFPLFRTLDQSEALSFYETLQKKLSLTTKITREFLTNRVLETGNSIESFDATKEDFELLSVFKYLHIQPPIKIFLNWYQYDNIDEFNFEDLNRFFEDIWYPSSDDIDLFPGDLAYVLSIYHNGRIKILNL